MHLGYSCNYYPVIHRIFHPTLLYLSIAGSDTTATAIRTTFLYIITTPRVYAKLLAEISDATLSSPISDVEARNCPYLQAVIKEGLRIWPPASGFMAKKVPPGRVTINGMYVPSGTRIAYGGFSVLRNKKIWGEDADLFRPERWFEGEKIKDLELAWEVIFNSGRYQCLGKNIALMELNKVFVEVSLSSSDSCASCAAIVC